MKKTMLLGAAIAAMTISSCSTIQHTATTTDVDSRVYNLTVAELDVANKKVEKTYNWSWNPFRSISLAREKKNLTASLLNESDADVLVEPQFEVTRRGIFRGGSITVTGFPAKYKNFHSMTREEAEAIAISNGTYPGSCTNPCGALGANPQGKSGNTNRLMPVSVLSQKPLTLREKTAGHTFATAVGGWYSSHGDVNSGSQWGVMLGRHGNRWSKYAKVMINTGTIEDDHEESTKTTAQLTIGTIYRISGAVGIFGGIGVGGTFTENEGSYYWKDDDEAINKVKFAVPVELGVQFNFGSRFNVIAGVGVPITNVSLNSTPFTPMVGLGYTF